MTAAAFWKTILPDLSLQFSLGKAAEAKTLGDIEKNLKKAIRKMDDEEFNVFLAQVVIKASSKNFMGGALTQQIADLKALRS